MKIAITGATGQFGSLVIESLLKTVPAGEPCSKCPESR